MGANSKQIVAVTKIMAISTTIPTLIMSFNLISPNPNAVAGVAPAQGKITPMAVPGTRMAIAAGFNPICCAIGISMEV